jgi:hypothetical protein
MYDEDTGQVMKNPAGEPFKRPMGNLPPCKIRGMGCDKGTPEDQRQLSPKNEQAYWHFLQCRATGRFPDDPIVSRNAAIIDEVLRLRDSEKWAEFRISILKVLTASAGAG